MSIFKAILLKLVSTLLFAVMGALVRWLGDLVPLGQMVFFRSFFAILPVMLIYAWRRELSAAMRTRRPVGHFGRGLIGAAGMFLNFAALARLPLADVTAILFASPLITVALAAMLLKERVRVYRWSAVAVGLLGVVVMLMPHLSVGAAATITAAGAIGALCAATAAFTNAGAVIQTRRLTDTETNSSIVFYFSVFCTLAGLLTWPFGWIVPTLPQLAALVMVGVIGGVSHLILTESFRFAPASVIAPFDYVSMLWAFVLGYILFGELPDEYTIAGAAVVIAAGLFVIWRERGLGLERAREKAAGTPSVG
ncbi:MAG: EamA family transporter [Rhizobiales bacterium]|nr:EamA family transporter [Hyphomicrobiales bacterium]